MATLIRRFFRNNVYLIDIQNPQGRVSGKMVQRLAADIYRQFGIKEFIGVAWRGGGSDHEKGLALDIIPNCFPFVPRGHQRITMDAVYDYLVAHTDKYKINYIIWQNMITEYPKWTTQKNIKNTKGKSFSKLHLDHIHVSFIKIGDQS